MGKDKGKLSVRVVHHLDNNVHDCKVCGATTDGNKFLQNGSHSGGTNDATRTYLCGECMNYVEMIIGGSNKKGLKLLAPAGRAQ